MLQRQKRVSNLQTLLSDADYSFPAFLYSVFYALAAWLQLLTQFHHKQQNNSKEYKFSPDIHTDTQPKGYILKDLKIKLEERCMKPNKKIKQNQQIKKWDGHKYKLATNQNERSVATRHSIQMSLANIISLNCLEKCHNLKIFSYNCQLGMKNLQNIHLTIPRYSSFVEEALFLANHAYISLIN